MSLVDRLAGIEQPKLPVHGFWAALVEFSQSEINKAGIVTKFDLSAGEQTELDWLITRYQASTNKTKFERLMHVIFILAEERTTGYITNADLVARINRID